MSYNKIRTRIRKGQEGLQVEPVEPGNPAEPVGPSDPAEGNNGVRTVLGQAAYNVGGQVAAGLGGETGANAYQGAVTGIKNAIKTGDVKGGVMAGVAGAVTMATSAMDNAFMGDKNFGAQSQAIDNAVHGVSGALMKTGNPYCVCAGTKVYTKQGYKNIEDVSLTDEVLGYSNKQADFERVEVIFPMHLKECIQIETECGNVLRCSTDHPIYASLNGRAKYVTVGTKKQRRVQDFQFRAAETLKIGDKVAEIGTIPFFGNKRIKDAYLIGLLVGGGTYGKRKPPRLFTADQDTWKFIKKETSGKLYKKYTDYKKYTREFREYIFYGFQALLQEHGIYEQIKKNKRLPKDIEQWDQESCAQLLAGLIDTGGCVQCNDKVSAGVIFYQANLQLLLEIKRLFLKFGIHSTIAEFKAKTGCIKGRKATSGTCYSLNIKRKESIINFYNNIPLNISYKKRNLYKAYLLKLNCKSRDTSYEFHNVIADKIKRIIPLGTLPVYNLQVSGSHTYIANNIVTHNCMAAGAIIEGVNFIDKAGGQTTPGFEVNIDNSGYSSNMTHMESKSNRSGAFNPIKSWIQGSRGLRKQLEDRNNKVRMALDAAEISEDQKFEQEARMNSVSNTIMNNQEALAGGYNTNALGM